ncbi:MAG: hypothetical protein GY853_16030 [PVC group bacterium]|nr:hypothetical protein [PVC group bacterium]
MKSYEKKRAEKEAFFKSLRVDMEVEDYPVRETERTSSKGVKHKVKAHERGRKITDIEVEVKEINDLPKLIQPGAKIEYYDWNEKGFESKFEGIISRINRETGQIFVKTGKNREESIGFAFSQDDETEKYKLIFSSSRVSSFSEGFMKMLKKDFTEDYPVREELSGDYTEDARVKGHYRVRKDGTKYWVKGHDRGTLSEKKDVEGVLYRDYKLCNLEQLRFVAKTSGVSGYESLGKSALSDAIFEKSKSILVSGRFGDKEDWEWDPSKETFSDWDDEPLDSGYYITPNRFKDSIEYNGLKYYVYRAFPLDTSIDYVAEGLPHWYNEYIGFEDQLGYKAWNDDDYFLLFHMDGWQVAYRSDVGTREGRSLDLVEDTSIKGHYRVRKDGTKYWVKGHERGHGENIKEKKEVKHRYSMDPFDYEIIMENQIYNPKTGRLWLTFSLEDVPTKELDEYGDPVDWIPVPESRIERMVRNEWVQESLVNWALNSINAFNINVGTDKDEIVFDEDEDEERWNEIYEAIPHESKWDYSKTQISSKYNKFNGMTNVFFYHDVGKSDFTEDASIKGHYRYRKDGTRYWVKGHERGHGESVKEKKVKAHTRGEGKNLSILERLRKPVIDKKYRDERIQNKKNSIEHFFREYHNTCRGCGRRNARYCEVRKEGVNLEDYCNKFAQMGVMNHNFYDFIELDYNDIAKSGFFNLVDKFSIKELKNICRVFKIKGFSKKVSDVNAFGQQYFRNQNQTELVSLVKSHWKINSDFVEDARVNGHYRYKKDGTKYWVKGHERGGDKKVEIKPVGKKLVAKPVAKPVSRSDAIGKRLKELTTMSRAERYALALDKYGIDFSRRDVGPSQVITNLIMEEFFDIPDVWNSRDRFYSTVKAYILLSESKQKRVDALVKDGMSDTDAVLIVRDGTPEHKRLMSFVNSWADDARDKWTDTRKFRKSWSVIQEKEGLYLMMKEIQETARAGDDIADVDKKVEELLVSRTKPVERNYLRLFKITLDREYERDMTEDAKVAGHYRYKKDGTKYWVKAHERGGPPKELKPVKKKLVAKPVEALVEIEELDDDAFESVEVQGDKLTQKLGNLIDNNKEIYDENSLLQWLVTQFNNHIVDMEEGGGVQSLIFAKNTFDTISEIFEDEQRRVGTYEKTDKTIQFDKSLMERYTYVFVRTKPTGIGGEFTTKNFTDWLKGYTGTQITDLEQVDKWLSDKYPSDRKGYYYDYDRFGHLYLNRESRAVIEHTIGDSLHPALKISTEFEATWIPRIKIMNDTLKSLKKHVQYMKGIIYTTTINDHPDTRLEYNAAGVYCKKQKEVHISQFGSGSDHFLKEVVVHEAAHSFHLGINILSENEQGMIKAFYHTHKQQVQRNGFTYASSNSEEFFAEAYVATVLPDHKPGFFHGMKSVEKFFKNMIEKYDFQVIE